MSRITIQNGLTRIIKQIKRKLFPTTDGNVEPTEKFNSDHDGDEWHFQEHYDLYYDDIIPATLSSLSKRPEICKKELKDHPLLISHKGKPYCITISIEKALLLPGMYEVLSKLNITGASYYFEDMAKNGNLSTNRTIFNHTAHKTLWNWLSENPNKSKSQWPGWEDFKKRPMNFCFACQTAFDIIRLNQLMCSYCPLCIRTIDEGSCLNGLFNEWENSKDPKERSEIAKQIRDLPVREDLDIEVI